jgi:hypothetical protein
MNWTRVLANGGVAFFTTLAALYAAGIGDIQVAIFAAFIQGGLAFFAEMKNEDATGKVLALGLLA